MGYSRADIERAERMANQAQTQVDAKAKLILRMKRSNLSTKDAEAALDTMVEIRDLTLLRFKTMQASIKTDDSSN
jgi:hypothetical protein